MTYDDWLKKDMKEYDGGREITSCKSFGVGTMPDGRLYIHIHTFVKGPPLLRVAEFRRDDEITFKAENIDLDIERWDDAVL